MSDPLLTFAASVRLCRDCGCTFETAWRASMPRGRPSNREAAVLLAALDETREVWRRCFEGQPPEPGERAALRLVELLTDEAEADAAGRDAGQLAGLRVG